MHKQIFSDATFQKKKNKLFSLGTFFSIYFEFFRFQNSIIIFIVFVVLDVELSEKTII
jgi:hypothetical protein